MNLRLVYKICVGFSRYFTTLTFQHVFSILYTFIEKVRIVVLEFTVITT